MLIDNIDKMSSTDGGFIVSRRVASDLVGLMRKHGGFTNRYSDRMAAFRFRLQREPRHQNRPRKP